MALANVGWTPRDTKYRWNWIAPLEIDPLDHNRVYAGAQVVFMTDNGGQSWKVISPDLTTDEAMKAMRRRHERRKCGHIH